MLLFLVIAVVAVVAVYAGIEALRRRARERRFRDFVAAASAAIDEIAAAAAAELASDLHPAESGLVQADAEWLVANATENLWERRDRTAVCQRNGISNVRRDFEQWSQPVRARLGELVADLPRRPPPELPVLSWKSVDTAWRPDDIARSIAMAPEPGGTWLAFSSAGELVRIDRSKSSGGLDGPNGSNASARLHAVVAPSPPGFEAIRGGELIRDGDTGRIAYWQRGWAQRGSTTFLLEPGSDAWKVYEHAYRSEDEHAPVHLAWAREHRALTSVFDGEQWNDRPAGLLQLALSASYGRVLASDAALLVVDMDNQLVTQWTREGWRLIARTTPPDDLDEFQRFPDPFTMSNRRAWVRYEPAKRRLVIADSTSYALDLRPVLGDSPK